ncbi:MAG: bifunctional oligoribonuclease/PAP phosphatase NrnA [Bacillaceae bacterium]|nr:bifunctional oligoribonuclease/PAP phosphatase NrnA [Bacillaceae bacterium]
MSKKEIISKIQEFDTIIIHRHVRPDPDAYGSQAGLAEIIKSSFPDKRVYIVGKEDPSLRFLTELDDIGDEVYEDALVIVCDTANQERICDERFNRGKCLIKIDHHPNVDPYGDVMWVDTSASSVSEMIYELYLAGREEGLTLNDRAARLIYAGIVGDTGRFLFPSTTPKTFQYAAELVQYDFDRKELYNQLYNTKHNIARLKGFILQNFTVSENGLSSVKITKNVLDEYGVSSEETSQLVGLLGDIEGIIAWVFFVEEPDVIRVRLRSKGPVVNEIAAHYNGGGHPMAAGASITKWEEAEEVIQDLEQACKHFNQENE